ncbi:MAG: hypothetical protein KJT03_06715, partial [Verrucomicrobiae bacterium]|nr:hypothetical protein [Verrucomicrobiae bacterium]
MWKSVTGFGLMAITLLAGCGKKQETSFSVDYEKYALENGLTVILHEDHSDPMVNVDVAYHVGSNREEP